MKNIKVAVKATLSIVIVMAWVVIGIRAVVDYAPAVSFAGTLGACGIGAVVFVLVCFLKWLLFDE